MGNCDTRKLKKMLQEITEGLGYECVDVAISGPPRSSVATLRIYIDTPYGVKHEDCEKTSRAVGEYMDACEEAGAPWLDGKYYVEVSSPGLERPLFTLEHYRRFAGSKTAIRTKSKKKISGKIESVGDNGVISIMLDDDSRIDVPFDDISRANLVFSIEKCKKSTADKRPAAKKLSGAKARNKAGQK